VRFAPNIFFGCAFLALVHQIFDLLKRALVLFFGPDHGRESFRKQFAVAFFVENQHHFFHSFLSYSLWVSSCFTIISRDRKSVFYDYSRENNSRPNRGRRKASLPVKPARAAILVLPP
jgi:hypothetical protein